MMQKEELERKKLEELPLDLLLSITTRQHNIYINHTLEKYNISSSEFPIIMKLYKEQKATQQQIAESFYLTKGTVTRTIKKLEDKQIIQRETNTKNRRENIVTLTENGKKIAKNLQEIEEEWEKQMTNTLTKKQTRELKKQILQITLNSFKTKEKLLKKQQKE